MELPDDILLVIISMCPFRFLTTGRRWDERCRKFLKGAADLLPEDMRSDIADKLFLNKQYRLLMDSGLSASISDYSASLVPALKREVGCNTMFELLSNGHNIRATLVEYGRKLDDETPVAPSDISQQLIDIFVDTKLNNVVVRLYVIMHHVCQKYARCYKKVILAHPRLTAPGLFAVFDVPKLMIGTKEDEVLRRNVRREDDVARRCTVLMDAKVAFHMLPFRGKVDFLSKSAQEGVAVDDAFAGYSHHGRAVANVVRQLWTTREIFDHTWMANVPYDKQIWKDADDDFLDALFGGRFLFGNEVLQKSDWPYVIDLLHVWCPRFYEFVDGQEYSKKVIKYLERCGRGHLVDEYLTSHGFNI